MVNVVRLRAPTGCRVTLAGGIVGLAQEADEVRSLLEAGAFEGVLLGIPFEDLDAIRATSGEEQKRDFVQDDADELYFKQLGKFGSVKVPPSDLYAAFQHAAQRNVPVEAIDLGDEGHTNVWTKHVGFFELMRNNRRMKQLKDAAFEARTPEEFAREWDRALFPTKGLRRVQQERADWMAKRLASLAESRKALFALVPLARWEGVRSNLVDRHRFAAD